VVFSFHVFRLKFYKHFWTYNGNIKTLRELAELLTSSRKTSVNRREPNSISECVSQVADMPFMHVSQAALRFMFCHFQRAWTWKLKIQRQMGRYSLSWVLQQQLIMLLLQAS